MFLRFIALIVLSAQVKASDGIQFFEENIRPLFAQHCTKCHGEEKQKGALRLDSVEGILAGGETEKLFVKGQPDNSFIIEAVKRLDEDFEMPPKNHLPEKDVQNLIKWVRMGAPMPAAKGPVKSNSSYDWKEETAFWSFQKPIKSTAQNIDSIINGELKNKILKPNPKADKITLVRRAAFDLLVYFRSLNQ